MRKFFLWIVPFVLFLVGCSSSHTTVVNNVDEREANEIVVFLASRGIKAVKLSVKVSGGIGASGPVMYGIAVEEKDVTSSMAVLNQTGLPRKKGTTLLELFAKQGLMTSEKEETIRYQAGLEEEMANTLCMIDGVLDACVKFSFPPEVTTFGSTAPPGSNGPPRATAAVFIKHQGVIDDPNSHIISKIKRLVAGSVNGLSIDDVTVITDKSRLLDVVFNSAGGVEVSTKEPKDYATVWSIIVAKQSLLRFRVLFFSLVFSNIVFLALLVWLTWKIYPIIKRKGGIQWFLDSVPLETNNQTIEDE